MSGEPDKQPDAVDVVVEGLLAGDIAALARAITAVEAARPAAASLLARIARHAGGARTVGFTGPPGVGKSTLISAFVGELRGRGQRVAVLAVDPSSPLSGGAILGDRVRMAAHADDRGVFIRSIASRGHLGGLSRTTAQVIELVDAAGFDVVVIETVGAGQSEVEVAGIADVTVVVTSPGAGDDVQAIKAGILEVADILVVNKADLDGARQARRALKAMLALRGKQRGMVPVIDTIAERGEGVAALADAVAAHHGPARAARAPAAARQRLLALLADSVARECRSRLQEDDPRAEQLATALASGACDPGRLAARILDHGLQAAIRETGDAPDQDGAPS